MSYQLKILKDHPIVYYPISETYTTFTGTYQDVLDNYATYQEFENDFLTYQGVTSNTVYDRSGCGNHGIYIGYLTDIFLPLTSGGSHAANITNVNYITVPVTYDYYGSTASGGFGTKYTSDNDFTLEAWIYTRISTTNIATIFADPINNVGLFWQNGNLIFKLNTEVLNYTVSNFKKSLHVVAVYSVTGMAIYVDGQLAASKPLSNFKFTNTSLNLQIGTTGHASDSFIVDDPAIYRYAIKQETVYSHFTYGQTINPIQLCTPEQGVLFSLHDENIMRTFEYSYPFNKSWENFTNEDVVFNKEEQSISIIPSSTVTAKTAEFSDYILFPTNIGIQYSKIEWSGDNGIIVETSTDDITYTPCINGQNIPQYANGSFASSGKLYIKFSLTTTDASKYIPKLTYLNISFFRSINLRADNSGNLLTPVDEEYYLGRKNYNILSRDYRNGLRCQVDGGFNINTNMLVKTIEFFYTPTSYADSGLISSLADTTYVASNYSWRNSGTVSKTNVAAIYVNGENKTSETAVSNVFTLNELHHVIIVYTEPISDNIKFNSSLYGSEEALYKNIIFYPTAFTSTKALNHYDLYTGGAAEVIYANSSAVTLTELSPDIYNNDWILVQSS